jgi:hypothetical protein
MEESPGSRHVQIAKCHAISKDMKPGQAELGGLTAD